MLSTLQNILLTHRFVENFCIDKAKAALWAARPSRIVGHITMHRGGYIMGQNFFSLGLGLVQKHYVTNIGPQPTFFGAKTLRHEHGAPELIFCILINLC